MNHFVKKIGYFAGGMLASLALATSLSVSAQLPDTSVYHLDANWVDQDNKPLAWNELQGKNQVISLIYTHCLHTCPTIVSTMQQAEKKLTDSTLAKTEFILVSLTPDSDTPEVLADFAKKHRLSKDKWHLLTGNEDVVRQLAMLLQVKYQNVPDNQVSHSNLVTVLNKQGEIVFQTLGEPSKSKVIAAALEQLE